MTIIKKENSAIIINEGRLVGQISKENNLYIFLFRPQKSVQSNSIETNNNTELWHDRLGHVNIVHLDEVAKVGLVERMKINKGKFTCGVCISAKQHREPFKNSICKGTIPRKSIYPGIVAC